ncbi:MAG: alpha/beta fold hydrolase [Streptomyces sp.]|uniref:alpha/beta fold hydrolase n=1 Tax=Streptomyces sp. TaxID=1931 RepID=UPI003D6C5F65
MEPPALGTRHDLQGRRSRAPHEEEISANAWSEAAADGWSTDSGVDTAQDDSWGNGQDDWAADRRGTLPTAVLVSTHDVTIRRWAERDHNVVRWTELDRGGHFLAMEAPDLLVSDVREFFGKTR